MLTGIQSKEPGNITWVGVIDIKFGENNQLVLCNESLFKNAWIKYKNGKGCIEFRIFNRQIMAKKSIKA